MVYDLKDLSEQIPDIAKQLADIFKKIDEVIHNISERLIGKINYCLEECIDEPYQSEVPRKLVKRLNFKNYIVERKTPKHIPYQKRVYWAFR